MRHFRDKFIVVSGGLLVGGFVDPRRVWQRGRSWWVADEAFGGGGVGGLDGADEVGVEVNLGRFGYWNARYIALSFKALERSSWTLPDHDVRRVRCMHHGHINFIGRHTVDMRHGPPKGKHRPLRLPAPQATTKTATTNKAATNG